MTNSNDAVELKPCPFCGGVPGKPFENLYDPGDDEEPVPCWTINHGCPKLACDLWVQGETAAETADKWNTRLSTPTGQSLPATDVTEELAKAFLAVVDAVRDFLPPDGIGYDDFAQRVIAATDNPEINPIIKELEHGRQ